MRRAFVLLALALLLGATVVHAAPSHVAVAARAPQAQAPATPDDDPGRAGAQVSPQANRSRSVAVDVVVEDPNGHNDVARVTVAVYKSDNTTVHRAAAEAGKLSASGKRGTWRVEITMNASDAPGTYLLRANATDRDGVVVFGFSSFEYEQLAALSVAEPQVELEGASAGFTPGHDGRTDPATVPVTNTGNVAVDLTLSSTALTNATHAASIPASSLSSSASPDMSAAIALSGSGQTLPGYRLEPAATQPFYLGVQVPTGLRPGDYVGELTVAAVAAG